MSSTRPAPYVPEDLVAQAQSNLLARDDGKEGKDNNYVPRSLLSLSLISLLDVDNPSSVIIDAMLSYSQACEAFHDGGAAPGIRDKVAFNRIAIRYIKPGVI